MEHAPWHLSTSSLARAHKSASGLCAPGRRTLAEDARASRHGTQVHADTQESALIWACSQGCSCPGMHCCARKGVRIGCTSCPDVHAPSPVCMFIHAWQYACECMRARPRTCAQARTHLRARLAPHMRSSTHPGARLNHVWNWL